MGERIPLMWSCKECNSTWLVPPDVGCPIHGVDCNANPPPEIWHVGVVPGYSLAITAHMRDIHRFISLARDGWDAVIDVGNDPYGKIVFRPEERYYDEFYKRYVRIDGLIDTRAGRLDRLAYHRAVTAVEDALEDNLRVVIHCAAGLRRAPHVVYGFLRKQGLNGDQAWKAVEIARPHAFSHGPYIETAESWLSDWKEDRVLSRHE